MGFERDFREEGISGRWNRWGDLHFGMIQDISFLERLFERGRENGKIVNVDFVAFLTLFWDVLLKREREKYKEMGRGYNVPRILFSRDFS